MRMQTNPTLTKYHFADLKIALVKKKIQALKIIIPHHSPSHECEMMFNGHVGIPLTDERIHRIFIR